MATKEQLLEKAKLYNKYNQAITLLEKHKEDTIDELVNNDLLEDYYYETIIICKPDITNKIYRNIVAKAKTILQKYIADIPAVADNFKVKDIGEKMLAYEVKSHKSGYYIMIYAVSLNVDEWETYLRNNKDVIKFIVIRADRTEEFSD